MVEVNERENAELSCVVARFISNQVYWSFNNVALQLGPRMKVDNSSSNGTVYNTLHITQVNVTDAGKYQCQFGEFNGNSEAAEIQLIVRGNIHIHCAVNIKIFATVNFTFRRLKKFDKWSRDIT